MTPIAVGRLTYLKQNLNFYLNRLFVGNFCKNIIKNLALAIKIPSYAELAQIDV